jgi:hypothetical protein
VLACCTAITMVSTASAQETMRMQASSTPQGQGERTIRFFSQPSEELCERLQTVRPAEGGVDARPVDADGNPVAPADAQDWSGFTPRRVSFDIGFTGEQVDILPEDAPGSVRNPSVGRVDYDLRTGRIYLDGEAVGRVSDDRLLGVCEQLYAETPESDQG